VPDVLFVCVHNSGRSQKAQALFDHLAAERGLDLRADSAGTIPGAGINPMAAEAMREIGIPIDAARPKLLTSELAKSATLMITMGCGVNAAACPAGSCFTTDWGLEDPAGQPIEKVRKIRDQVKFKVEELLDSMTQGI
jgi:arsenate reductase